MKNPLHTTVGRSCAGDFREDYRDDRARDRSRWARSCASCAAERPASGFSRRSQLLVPLGRQLRGDLDPLLKLASHHLARVLGFASHLGRCHDAVHRWTSSRHGSQGPETIREGLNVIAGQQAGLSQRRVPATCSSPTLSPAAMRASAPSVTDLPQTDPGDRANATRSRSRSAHRRGP